MNEMKIPSIRLMAMTALLVLSAGIAAAANSPQHAVGSGPDDWWISYPDQRADGGNAVTHPDWILDTLQDRPVIIYGHKECPWCPPQEEAVKKLVGEHESEIEYFDIWVDGRDSRYVDLVNYDPNGEGQYVPFTIILTLVRDDDGRVRVGWHSAEEVTGEEWVRSYVEDAITYYDQNAGSWER